MPSFTTANSNLSYLTTHSATDYRRTKYYPNEDAVPEFITTVREIDRGGVLLDVSNIIDYPGDVDQNSLRQIGYRFYNMDPTLQLPIHIYNLLGTNDSRPLHGRIYWTSTALNNIYYRQLFLPRYLLTTDSTSIPTGNYFFQKGKTLSYRRNQIENGFVNVAAAWPSRSFNYTTLPADTYASGYPVDFMLTMTNPFFMESSIADAIIDNILDVLQTAYPTTNVPWLPINGDIASSTTHIWAKIIVNQADYNLNMETQVIGQLLNLGLIAKNMSIEIIADDASIMLPFGTNPNLNNTALLANEFTFVKFKFTVTSFTKSNLHT